MQCGFDYFNTRFDSAVHSHRHYSDNNRCKITVGLAKYCYLFTSSAYFYTFVVNSVKHNSFFSLFLSSLFYFSHPISSLQKLYNIIPSIIDEINSNNYAWARG